MINTTYLSHHNVPCIVLSTLPAFSVIFRATHFTEEETEPESLNTLSKVIHLTSGKAQPRSQVFLMPKTCPLTTVDTAPTLKDNTVLGMKYGIIGVWSFFLKITQLAYS